MNISAVLLAGGESRRMGKDKATLLFRSEPLGRNEPLWQIQLDLLRKLAPVETLISARSDPAWRPADVHFVADAPPSRGPLSGIGAALARAATTHLLTLAIDMPFMNEQYLRLLYRGIEPGRGVIPVMGERAEPLAAIYPAEARADFAAALAGLDFSLQKLAKELLSKDRLRLVRVKKEEEALFRNLNEPTDLDPDNCVADQPSAIRS
jgi:molybdopterin-guanine dinucleotide biosynthesis protein A